MPKARNFLGTDLPIIQAPMAGVQDSALTIAVCNAGGLGSLPCAMLSPAVLRQELESISSKTAAPYNVNFFCHQSPAPHLERAEAWKARLLPYYRELGIPTDHVPSSAQRSPFDDEMADVLGEFQPPIVSFHFGLPSTRLIAKVKRWDAKILSSATTLEEALWLEEHGADAIICQGLEAGGHRAHFLSDDLTRQAGTLALLPQMAAAVKLPVIAAGGIADAKGVQAALALGAAAVQVGTAYLLCSEATTSSVHRASLQGGEAHHTALTNLFSGRPARGIVNRLMREMGPLDDEVPEFPLASHALSSLRSEAERRGKGDFSPMWAGQNVSGCREIGAAELTRGLSDGLQ